MNNLFFDNFSESIQPVRVKCTNLFDKLKLDNKWNPELFFKLEIKKSYIKSVLRYCPETQKLQKSILVALKKKFNEFGYTQFYPMLHLSQDKLEAGGFHYDQVDSKAIHTLWIAISDYSYNGLAIMPYNIQNSFFNRLIIKSGITKILSKNISVKRGDSFLWPGTLIHAGNFNNSNNYSLAMQMKIIGTKNTFAFEKTKQATTVDVDYFNTDHYTEGNEIKDFDCFSDLIHHTVEISTEKSSFEQKFSKINQKIISLEKNINRQVVSFAFSILSQRLLFSNKFNMSNSPNNQNLSLMLDFASLALGSENLISKKRILSHNSSLKNSLSSILKIH